MNMLKAPSVLVSGSCQGTLSKKISIGPISLMAQTVKNLAAMQETWVWSLGQEDPLGKGMATHSSILAWRIPWIEEPGGLQSTGLQRVRHDWVTNTFSYWQPPYPCIFLIVFAQATSLALKIETERVTGRKARGLKTGNRLQEPQIFYLF